MKTDPTGKCVKGPWKNLFPLNRDLPSAADPASHGNDVSNGFFRRLHIPCPAAERNGHPLSRTRNSEISGRTFWISVSWNLSHFRRADLAASGGGVSLRNDSAKLQIHHKNFHGEAPRRKGSFLYSNGGLS